jgi:tetratricopeptide (TPR) repeat protein
MLHALAREYRAQGKYAEAEPLYARALAIKEAKKGRDHPSTAATLGNLAGLYEAQGKYAEAEPLYALALAIDEQHLAAEHVDVGIDCLRYAVLLEVIDRGRDAADLLTRASRARAELLPFLIRRVEGLERGGGCSAALGFALLDLARFQMVLGDAAAALAQLRRASALLEEALRQGDPALVLARAHLATVQLRALPGSP